ncbi:MAG: hypothetical protein U0625_09815 [Phycisphaerales bacterium]
MSPGVWLQLVRKLWHPDFGAGEEWTRQADGTWDVAPAIGNRQSPPPVVVESGLPRIMGNQVSKLLECLEGNVLGGMQRLTPEDARLMAYSAAAHFALHWSDDPPFRYDFYSKRFAAMCVGFVWGIARAAPELSLDAAAALLEQPPPTDDEVDDAWLITAVGLWLKTADPQAKSALLIGAMACARRNEYAAIGGALRGLAAPGGPAFRALLKDLHPG